MIYVFLADGFEELEALATVDILRRAELEVKTVGVGVGGRTVTSSHGVTVIADIEEKDVTTDDMELVVLPGGMPGTLNLEKSPIVTASVRYCLDNSLHVAAICAAPSILGHMGVLKGCTATCFPGFEKELAGASLSSQPVCVSGRIITGKGAGVVIDFALRIVAELCGSQQALAVKKAIQYQSQN